jgi:thiol peroxidase
MGEKEDKRLKTKKRAKQEPEERGKGVNKLLKRTVRKTSRKVAEPPLKKAKKSRGKTFQLPPPRDTLIHKVRQELADKEEIIRESQETIRETMAQAGREIAILKEKTSQSILEMKGKAEAEVKKLKEELEAQEKTLRGKVTELEEYRKAAEGKIFELQAKVMEWAAKVRLTEKERPGLVTSRGKPLTLLGEEVRVGDKAPNFQVLDHSMQPVTLGSYQGKIKIITAVPSLDTPVCNMETRRFNQEAEKLPQNVAILTISMDLPFAQARWCAAARIEKVKPFSDYRDHAFGLAYGVLIKERRLLARAVFIIDDRDIVRYVELVPEIAQEPDYERILNAVRALSQK